METSEKPNVVLIYPKTGLELETTISPPHGILAVAAPVQKAGYKVKILDQRLYKLTDSLLENLISPELVCFGISAMTGTQIKMALGIARALRRLTGGKIPIVWGGTHPSVMPEQTLENENVDIVVVGEGDESFLELVNSLRNKTPLREIKGILFEEDGQVVNTGVRPLLDVEKLLPVPWDLVEVEKYVHKDNDIYIKGARRVLDLGQTSRGCPFKCGFCSSASIRGRKWRPLSAERSLEIITEGVKRFNLDGFWLRDDEFYIDRERAYKICRGIIEAGLKTQFYTAGTRVDVFLKSTHEQLVALREAGAETLKFGAESGSQRILDLMNKGIKVEDTLRANKICMEYGFLPTYTLLIGYPTETFEDMNMTIDMAYRLKAENPQAHFETIASYTAFPGTPDFQIAMDNGLVPPQSLEEWADWTLDDYDFEGRKLPWLTREERIWVGNISYMSILADSMDKIVMSMGKGLGNKLLMAAARPFSGYFHLRLKNKLYKHVPELAIIRKLRKKMFQTESTVTGD
ncbi:B12-binding domain-containing radical SAM protein [bacterium]|nr:MAG: B12-binding domain-containing radical SAM protein [bacterium]